jgi:hypothetical protein
VKKPNLKTAQRKLAKKLVVVKEENKRESVLKKHQPGEQANDQMNDSTHHNRKTMLVHSKQQLPQRIVATGLENQEKKT